MVDSILAFRNIFGQTQPTDSSVGWAIIGGFVLAFIMLIRTQEKNSG